MAEDSEDSNDEEYISNESEPTISTSLSVGKNLMKSLIKQATEADCACISLESDIVKPEIRAKMVDWHRFETTR